MSATICDCYNCTAIVKATFSVSDVKVLWSTSGLSSWGLPAGPLGHKVLPHKTIWKMGRLLLHSFLVFNWHFLNNTHNDKVSCSCSAHNRSPLLALEMWDVFRELEAMICVPAQQYVDNILLELTMFEWDSAISIKSTFGMKSVFLSTPPTDCLYVWTSKLPVIRHATSPCEHRDLYFLHPFFVLSPYSQLSPYFTHFPEKILIRPKPV